VDECVTKLQHVIKTSFLFERNNTYTTTHTRHASYKKLYPFGTTVKVTQICLQKPVIVE